MPLGSKLTPPQGSQFYIELYKEKLKMTSSLEPLMVIWPNSTGMVPGWCPTKVVQMVLIGCICRTRGQKVGFKHAIFNNILDWNYKAQSFHIWYIASSRGPLPKLFNLCPWDQNWRRPVGHNFTLNYIMKSSNDIFSWTANGNLTKLNRNGHWVVPDHNCSNSSDSLHM